MATTKYWIKESEANEKTKAPPLITFGGPGLKCSVAPSKGANLTSYAVEEPSGSGDWLEMLYRGNDFSTTMGWDGKSPVLFPAVGRNFTSEQIALAKRAAGSEGKVTPPGRCRYTVGLSDGEKKDIPLHGFARDMACWKVTERSVNEEGVSVGLMLDASDLPSEVQAMYPFRFVMHLYYRITEQDGLILDLVVENRQMDDDNSLFLPFSFGTHPTFKLPFVKKNLDWSEAYLVSTNTVNLHLDSFSCLTGESNDLSVTGIEEKRRAAESVHLPVRSYCDNVMGKATPYLDLPHAKTTLVSPQEKMRMTVTQTLLDEASFGIHAKDLYMVYWGEESKQFICVEPWMGGPNSLNTGQGAVMLKNGESFRMRHSYVFERYE